MSLIATLNSISCTWVKKREPVLNARDPKSIARWLLRHRYFSECAPIERRERHRFPDEPGNRLLWYCEGRWLHYFVLRSDADIRRFIWRALDAIALRDGRFGRHIRPDGSIVGQVLTALKYVCEVPEFPPYWLNSRHARHDLREFS